MDPVVALLTYLLGVAVVATGAAGGFAARWARGKPLSVIVSRLVVVLLSAGLVSTAIVVVVPIVRDAVFPTHQTCATRNEVGSVDWVAPSPGGEGAVLSGVVDQPVAACQTFMLTGASFTAPDGTNCQGTTTKLCVLLIRATFPTSIRITDLEATHTWFGVTDSDVAQALAWQTPEFWTASNCETGRGCDDAAVFQYLDGEFQARFDLIRVSAQAAAQQTATPTTSGPSSQSTSAGTAASGCVWGVTASWDNNGAGHDNYAQAVLEQPYPPCSTVMVSSATLDTPDGGRCQGGLDVVCVEVWTTAAGGDLRVTGLTADATWWGRASALPEAAIADKASLSNPLGWFGPRNCSTGTGCAAAHVWIVNGDTGSFSEETVSRP